MSRFCCVPLKKEDDVIIMNNMRIIKLTDGLKVEKLKDHEKQNRRKARDLLYDAVKANERDQQENYQYRENYGNVGM